VIEEMKAIGKISFPTAITGLLLYSRAMISMLFLSHLGETQLAGGSLSIGFANITGYSVLSGLAMGMEPICGQAYGAKQWKILGLTLQKTTLLLLSTSIPISCLWLNMKKILLFFGQDQEISSTAHTFILFSLPDLFFLSFLHPLRIYLRTQNITLPLTCCSAISIILHVPLNFLLVNYFKMGVAGVSIAMIWFNLNLLIFLSFFVFFSRVYKDSWVSPSMDCFRGWSSLLSLSIPSCVSVCLEWWWYEIMLFLCGLLSNPQTSVSTMGILIQTLGFLYVFPFSLSASLTTRIGHSLGSGQASRAQGTAIIGILIAFLLGTSAFIGLILVRKNWGKLFTDEVQIIDMIRKILPILGLCEISNWAQTVSCGILAGTARPYIGARINLCAFYLIGLPISIFATFVYNYGLVGLWYGMLAAQVSCVCMMLYTLIQTDWGQQTRRALELSQKSAEQESVIDEESVLLDSL
jgi:MATE family multidrug resistance protein